MHFRNWTLQPNTLVNEAGRGTVTETATYIPLGSVVIQSPVYDQASSLDGIPGRYLVPRPIVSEKNCGRKYLLVHVLSDMDDVL